MSSQRWKHRFPTDGDLAINECQKVREAGTDSIVWMREEKHVRRTCGSRVLRMQFNAPDVEIIRGFLCGGNKRCSAAGMQSVERRLTRENTSNSCREKETSHYGHKQYNHR